MPDSGDDGVDLNTPIPNCDLGRTAFYNGRLLSAEDLQREQRSQDFGQMRLARLIGCGIERGLGVERDGATAVRIKEGLGVTPSGWVVFFPETKINLVPTAVRDTVGSTFVQCDGAFNDLRAPSNGSFLLVLTPNWVRMGRASSTLGELGDCNRNLDVPAVRARLLKLDDSNLLGPSLRNQIAVALFAASKGESDLVGWLPSGRVSGLAQDDLPLAVLSIDAQSNVVFVDQWAARRQLAPPPGGTADALWPKSRSAEMEAFGRQFLEQLLVNELPLKWDESTITTLPPVVTWHESEFETAVVAWGDGELNGAWNVLSNLFGVGEPRALDEAEFARRLHDGLQCAPVPLVSMKAHAYTLAGDNERCLIRFEANFERSYDDAQTLKEYTALLVDCTEKMLDEVFIETLKTHVANAAKALDDVPSSSLRQDTQSARRAHAEDLRKSLASIRGEGQDAAVAKLTSSLQASAHLLPVVVSVLKENVLPSLRVIVTALKDARKAASFLP